ncbi:hypothetical protein EDB84DRAFT_1441955 [Lactarius hengduanensis]|nr:hypothetical protein EDB84DRAFT_1441955 [Lactarius hengduanensis]
MPRAYRKNEDSQKAETLTRIQLLELSSQLRRNRKLRVHTALENPRVKTKKPIAPRSPLPQRINRVVQPGKPVMPRPKRTSAEVAAALAEKAKLLRRVEELDKEKKLALAELDLDEEAQDAVEERIAYSESEEPQAETLDNALEVRPVDEEGSQDEDDEPPRSEDQGSEPETMPQKVKKRKKKPAKGETRKAVEDMKMNLRREQEETLTGKRPGVNHEAHRPVSRGGQTTRETPSPRDDAVLSDNALGGLADEDADSKRPSSKMSKGRDVTRKNEIVRIAGQRL